MTARWLAFLKVFLVWLIGFLLSWIILFLGHEVLMVFAVNTLQLGKYIAPLIHILYYCITGLLMVAYFILSLEFLKRSSQKGRLLRGALQSIGLQLLIIGLAQAVLTLYGFFPADRFGILLMAAEGLTGAGMILFAGRRRVRIPETDAQGRI